jgi:hypothetical protein
MKKAVIDLPGRNTDVIRAYDEMIARGATFRGNLSRHLAARGGQNRFKTVRAGLCGGKTTGAVSRLH